MNRSILGVIGIALLGTSYLQAAGQEPSGPPAASPQRAILTRYCITCHNERLQTADLLLDKADVDSPAANSVVWEKVVRKLRSRAMPPAGMPRPDEATYDSLATYLETALDGAAAAKPNPGRPPDHRLNRAEYANAVRDLLGVEIDEASFLPPDDAYFGFDNNGEVLSVSPLLMERYMTAAGKISRLAVGDAQIRPNGEEYSVPELSMQRDRESMDLPFGSRGGIAIRHSFPLDGEYVIQIQLRRNDDGFIRGLGEEHLLDVRLDDARVHLFRIGGVRKGRGAPLFTRNDPPYRGDPEQVEYDLSADTALKVRFAAKAGTRTVGVAFLEQDTQPEGIYMPPILSGDMRRYRGGEPAVNRVMIAGPYNPAGIGDTPSRQKIFVCTPDEGQEDPCARKILARLARHAYRRPPAETEIQDLLSLYRRGRSRGSFEAGVQMALQRILAGPEFIFRTERDPANVPPDTTYRIPDLELASRLSFFLWSSLPDEELLDLAERGQLRDPAVLEQQARRMLADSRSKAMVSNFAGQWLNIRHLRAVLPDLKVFPDFDADLADAMEKETELFFESNLREDRPVMGLLTADYTFLNERLARHYGIPDVYGNQFRRVAVTDEARQGLLGEGTILTTTSRANRTSPVLRGKWVLDNLLGVPPPPPPPNVAAGLKEKSDEGKVLTVRQQTEAHRSNPACSSCHSLMDPIGFALDRFNGVGQLRITDAGGPLDVSGVLYDGTKFEGPAGLRKVLLDRQEQIVTTVTEKLLTYALGRALQSYDQPAVRKILREAAPSDYRWSSLVAGIVNSLPFQMRRSREP